RTPAQAPVVVSPTPAPEAAPAAAPEVEPAMAVPEEEPNALTASKPAISVPGPEPTRAIAAQATVPNVPPPSLASKKQALPDFRLNGIIYTVLHPSAIVNGATVYAGDQVN